MCIPDIKNEVDHVKKMKWVIEDWTWQINESFNFIYEDPS